MEVMVMSTSEHGCGFDIAAARRRLQLSQEKAAAAAGLSLATYRVAERVPALMTPRTAARLAALFGAPVAEILAAAALGVGPIGGVTRARCASADGVE
jgi:DNA-binding XRE family transcriptional regulator